MPFLGLFVMSLLWGAGQSFPQFVQNVYQSHDMASKVYTLSLLANLIPFVWFTSIRNDNWARGVFVATMLYVLYIVAIKYIL